MRFEKLLLAAAALCLVCMAPACSDDDPATDPEQNETPGTPGEGEGDGDDDSGEPGEPDTPDTPALTEGVRAEGYYKGDYHDEGTGNYWINFTVEDENDPGGYYILCLDFNGSLAADPDFAARPVVRIASDAVRDLHHLCSERISVWTGRSPAPASARSSHKNV